MTLYRAGPGGRRVLIEPYRRFARVVVDRDAFVYDARSDGLLAEAALRPGFAAAVDRLMGAATVHLWAAGYTGGFSISSGDSRVWVYVPHQFADVAAEAMAAAEFDGDLTGLEDLTARLAIPLDDWLAPGERELRQGVDFTAPVSTFLKFLRGQAHRRGLRLNGRAEPGRVWVRPTVADPRGDEQLQQHVGRGEREGAPPRPPLERRGGPRLQPDPVGFLAAAVRAQECPCGRGDLPEDGGHGKAHLQWSIGVRIPRTVAWGDGPIAVVGATSPFAWRKLGYDCARLPQRENGYDAPSFDVGDGRRSRDDRGRRAYLYRAGDRVVGFAAVYDTTRAVWRSWDPEEGASPPDDAGRSASVIHVIFTADVWRRQGVARELAAAVAANAGCAVGDLAWGLPFSKAGCALARSLSPAGVWLG